MSRRFDFDERVLGLEDRRGHDHLRSCGCSRCRDRVSPFFTERCPLTPIARRLIGQRVKVILHGRRQLEGTVAAVNDNVLVLCVHDDRLCFVDLCDVQAICTEHHD